MRPQGLARRALLLMLEVQACERGERAAQPIALKGPAVEQILMVLEHRERAPLRGDGAVDVAHAAQHARERGRQQQLRLGLQLSIGQVDRPGLPGQFAYLRLVSQRAGDARTHRENLRHGGLQFLACGVALGFNGQQLGGDIQVRVGLTELRQAHLVEGQIFQRLREPPA
jgi:hypothetical protein